MKKGLLIAFLSLLIDFSFGQTIIDLSGDYFGQNVPHETPLVFGSGYISTSDLEHSSPVFSHNGNEVYWSKIIFSNDSVYQIIMYSRQVDCKWTQPTLAPFSDGKHYEGGLIISPDNSKLYIYRGKPAPPNGNADSINIICYSKKDNQWVDPQIVCAGFSPSVTIDGTIYFSSELGISRIFLKNGKYVDQELLNNRINLKEFQNWTPYISPDESFLIFSSNRPGSMDNYGDLYISFRKDNDTGDWSEPLNMGNSINTWAQERFPYVSPDGKYLFFTRWTKENNQDVFWVNTDIIEKLRSALLNK